MAAGEFEYAFQAPDALLCLIIYTIKYHGDASGVNNDQAKAHYLTKTLSIFVLVLANMHEAPGSGPGKGGRVSTAVSREKREGVGNSPSELSSTARMELTKIKSGIHVRNALNKSLSSVKWENGGVM